MNSRSKGQRAERAVAKLLETWTKKKFARSPSSGGLQWHRRSDTTGDIVCTTEGHKWPFSTEVKSYGNINFEHLLYLDKADILKFWAQSSNDAEKAKKIPMVMMRYNSLPRDFYFTLLPIKYYTKVIKPLFKEPPKTLTFRQADPKKCFVILSSKDLLQLDYKILKNLTKEWQQQNK